MMNINEAKSNNIKRYLIYRALSVDLLFYRTIKFLFLCDFKGISASDIIMSSALYALFRVLTQFFITIIADKIGSKKGAILGNIFNTVYIVGIINSNNLIDLIFAEFFSSIGNGFKSIADPSILNTSIEGLKSRGKIFSKIDGKGVSIFYFIDAILAIFAGILYDINPYIPMISAALGGIISIILSLRFEEITTKKKEKIEVYMKNIKSAIKFSITSSRMKALLLFSGIMWGIICLMDTYQTNLLKDLQFSATNIGIVYAGLRIITAISSRRQGKFNDKYKNKSLEHMGYAYTIAILIAGLIVIIENINFAILTVIVLATFAVMQYNSGIYTVLIKRYLGNFSTAEQTQNIYSINELFSNIMRLVIGIIGSILLKVTTTSYAIIILGSVSLITIMTIIQYMSSRVGLDPTEYKTKDIKMKTLN